jgi:hypothetical protein
MENTYKMNWRNRLLPVALTAVVVGVALAFVL